MQAISTATAGAPADERTALAAHYRETRALTEALAGDLSPEDQVAQSMEDASPAKWHRAHTTWFFETFLLVPLLPGYRVFHESFGFLFNSYYEAVGARHARPHRGLVTRPGAEEVAEYRAYVDAAMERLMTEAETEAWPALAPLIELGINHEQQHQELLLTDLLHLFSFNALHPVYRTGRPAPAATAPVVRWLTFDGGIAEIGHDGQGFAFDNEGPAHAVALKPFRLASRPVTNAEIAAFIADGGYADPQLWLSDGWATAQAGAWRHPLYWEDRDGEWWTMSLTGFRPVEMEAPAAHISYYEADAYARWAGKRLPTEAEWELAATDEAPSGNTLGSGYLRPVAVADDGAGPLQMFGDVWEWTASPYVPYPGFRIAEGAVGEYNGKFMVNQLVLRGGSCATPDGHVRATYRNFFYPHQRWQFSGLRLAEDG